MIKINILLLLTLLYSIGLQAQFKFNVNGGLSNNLNGNNDSTTLASKNGTSFGIKPSYSFGRIAIAASINSSTHTNANVDEVSNRFTLPTGVKIIAASGGGVSTISAFIGPELCICFKKIKIIPTIKAGIVQTKVEALTTEIPTSIGQARSYSIPAQTNSDFATQTGVTFGYRLSKHLSINAQSELTNYTSTFKNVDNRFINPNREINQKFNFLKMAGGLTYNF